MKIIAEKFINKLVNVYFIQIVIKNAKIRTRTHCLQEPTTGHPELGAGGALQQNKRTAAAGSDHAGGGECAVASEVQKSDRPGGAGGDSAETELGLAGREREDIETAASEEVGV